MELEDKIRCNELLKEKHSNWIGLSNQKAIRSMLEELDRLQKENEIYENKIILSDEEYRRVIDEAQKDCVQKDKIKELIVKWKPKLKETDKKVEEAITQEERVVLKCIGIRIDERIKTLESLLKEE